MPRSEGCAAVPQRHRRGALPGPSRLPHGLWLGPRRDRGHLVAREAGVRIHALILGSGEPFPRMGGRRWSQARPAYPPPLLTRVRAPMVGFTGLNSGTVSPHHRTAQRRRVARGVHVRRPCPPRRSLRATRRGRSLYSSGSLAVAGFLLLGPRLRCSTRFLFVACIGRESSALVRALRAPRMVW